LQCATPDFGVLPRGHTSKSMIRRLKNSSFLSRQSRRSRHAFLQLAFCSVVGFFGTILAHNFLMPKSHVKIWWTVNRFKRNSLLIILTVKPTIWPHSFHIVVRFWGWRSSRTRLVFYLFSAS
jgi:hypothetical protein